MEHIVQKEKRLVLIIFECRIPQQLKRFQFRRNNSAARHDIDNYISSIPEFSAAFCKYSRKRNCKNYWHIYGKWKAWNNFWKVLQSYLCHSWLVVKWGSRMLHLYMSTVKFVAVLFRIFEKILHLYQGPQLSALHCVDGFPYCSVPCYSNAIWKPYI